MVNEIAIGTTSQADGGTKEKRFSRYAATASRGLLGFMFFVAGINGLVPFLPAPAPDAMPAGAFAFSVALFKTGYLVQLIGATQAVAGALLLSNRYVPLALTVLAPVVVNIVAFHAFLAPQGLPIALVVLALEIHLAFVHREAFRSVVRSGSPRR